jgi:RNase P/RNase MRP subunit POP5
VRPGPKNNCKIPLDFLLELNSINLFNKRKMEYMLIVREGFREEVEKNMLAIGKFTNEELVHAYNRNVKIGIVAAYAQAVYLVSMRYVFLERFKKSPVLINDKIILKLSGMVKLDNELLFYLDNEPVA